MKKLESLNNDLFKKFENEKINSLNSIYGGIATCYDNCKDSCTRRDDVRDDLVITNEDC